MFFWLNCSLERFFNRKGCKVYFLQIKSLRLCVTKKLQDFIFELVFSTSMFNSLLRSSAGKTTWYISLLLPEYGFLDKNAFFLAKTQRRKAIDGSFFDRIFKNELCKSPERVPSKGMVSAYALKITKNWQPCMGVICYWILFFVEKAFLYSSKNILKKYLWKAT